jgi:hypothetical protein
VREGLLVFARYGFRWILACMMAALNLCLLGVSIATEPKTQPAAQLTRPDDSAETVTFSPTRYPPTSITFKIAVFLNLPAMFVGGIAAIFVPHNGQTMDIAFCTIFAFPLWYRIGRWIDRQTATTGPPALGPVRATLRGFAQGFASLLLALFIFSFTPAFHERNYETRFLSLVYACWCAGYLACSIWGARRENRKLTSGVPRSSEA